MSINHFSSDLPETLWWTQPPPMVEPPPNPPSSTLHKPVLSHLHHRDQPIPTTAAAHSQNPTFNFNLNQENEEEHDEQVPDERENPTQNHQEKQKEAMFEKPLTPSDVGKLNRLVIPKQYAEKYFPLGGGDSVEKGLLLSFEDESGKSWRFRYSYWNSSQSYVLTKGWSRFVKEKRLDAGDIVLFERDRAESERLFIGWRRRGGSPVGESGVAQPAVVVVGGNSGGGWTRALYAGHPYPSHPPPRGPTIQYQPDCLHAGSIMQNQTTPSGNSKRLRLFGVNLECQQDESEPPTPDGSSISSQGQAHYQHYSNAHALNSNHYNHLDINFSRDVNQMRYHQG